MGHGITTIVGLSRVDITPKKPVNLSGFAARQGLSEGVYQPLYVNALSLSDKKEAVMILSIDWLFLDELLTHLIRKGIAAKTGLSEKSIIITATHTHTGPVVRAIDIKSYGDLDNDYLEEAIKAIVACAEDAFVTPFKAVIKRGLTHSNMGCSRRYPDGKGGIRFKPNPKGPRDGVLPFMTVETLEGEVKGLFFNYACHPTCIADKQIGRDWPGFVQDALEEKYPHAITAFWMGCAADQKHAATDDQGDFRGVDLAETKALGQKLAQKIIDVIEAGNLTKVSGTMKCRQTIIPLTSEGLKREDYERYLKESNRPDYLWDKKGTVTNDPTRQWAEAMLKKLNAEIPLKTETHLEIINLTFGKELALIFFGAEVVVDYGLKLRSVLSPQIDQIITITNTNNNIGYIATADQIPEGGYEVMGSQIYSGRPGPFVKETEEKILSAIINLNGNG
jgi:neutral ceramidase